MGNFKIHEEPFARFGGLIDKSVITGVVFTSEQARLAFSSNYRVDAILCVKGEKCKWVESTDQAHDFYIEHNVQCFDCDHIYKGKIDFIEMPGCPKCGAKENQYSTTLEVI